TISSSQSLFTCADIVQQIPLPPSLTLWINEIHYDNVGTDQDEFIEIAGTANADLTGYTLVLYNGSNGSVYDTQVLNGSLSDDGNGFGFFVVNYPSNGIQNGPDGVALIDPNGVPIDYFSYEGSFLATDGPLLGLNLFEIDGEESGSTPIGFSLQLNGTGSQGIDFTSDTIGSSTPGSANIDQVLLNYTLNPISINLIAEDLSGNQSTCLVEVTVLDTINRNEVRTFESCGSVLFNGISYSSDTVLVDTIQSANGCDSTITTILNVLETDYTSLAPVSSCPPYIWQGQTITQSGLYTDTLTSSNGCDSILAIDVTIIEPPLVSINIDSPISCVGDNDAEISAVISGGVPPYLADWSIDGLGDFDDGIIQVNVGEGFYSVQIEDATGCRSNTVSIDLFDPDVITIFSTSFPELEGSSIDITIVGGSPPFSFDWNYDGIGDNDDPEDLVLASPNAYSVIVTDANGCTAFFSDTIDLGGYPTSILHVEGFDVFFYPNPTNGIVNVFYESSNNQPILLEVVDIQGRLLQANHLNVNGMMQIDLSHLPDGTYLARFSQQDLIKDITIIKAE
ncbi:MAG: T9SS type A sorting domain-containing protein, partial [Bacteroidota bacterium]|nr:T9SS type A sorting domain-containing protein [Bacteroidota bacterium]